MRATTEELFWRKVEKTDSCWEWTAAKCNGGYGLFGVKRRMTGAHRYSYELHHGPIDPGMFIDHMCHNRGCVNPGHLRQVTPKQNQENRHGAQRGNSSGVRGVSWISSRGHWAAGVKHNNRSYNVGSFATIAEAEAAVIERRKELFTHNDMDRITR
jgi:hypothetical protein